MLSHQGPALSAFTPLLWVLLCYLHDISADGMCSFVTCTSVLIYGVRLCLIVLLLLWFLV